MRLRSASLCLALASACAGGQTRTATAESVVAPEDGAPERRAEPGRDRPEHAGDAGWRQFVQPDALVFVWGSAAVAATAHTVLEPPEEPRGFGPDEGGEPANGETIPNWQVGLGVAVAPILVGAADTEGAWYHAKGISQSILTTAAATELAKNAFGRRRPSFDDEGASVDDRKSFFSGHSSLTWSTTVYAGLYLHDHVFAGWRGDAAFAWWEVPPYLALGALSVWVPYTRLEDNKHHLSDVVTGGAVGASLSLLFYTWQERRYRSDHRGEPRMVLTPLVDAPGLAASGSF